jgi:Ala-tRNA(Pro) deacylase
MYVNDFLRSSGVWFETLLYRPASSSTKRAKSIGVPGRAVAKAVLVETCGSFVVTVLPSIALIDLARVADVLGASADQVRLATSAELLQIFSDCEPGVVPPFGRLYGLTTLVDSCLAESSEIVVAANTRHEGMRIRFDDFQALEHPVNASFTRPLSAKSVQPMPGRRRRNRRAG